MNGNCPKKMKEYCNSCSQSTWHSIEASFRQTHYLEECDLEGYETCYILKCCGCQTTSFYREFTLSEDPGGEPYSEVFPPRSFRKEPKWLSMLEPIYLKTIQEVYAALGNNCLALAAMGIRSIVDAYIVEKVGDCGSFATGLKTLLEQKHITPPMKEILDIVVDCGNAVTHRNFKPTEKMVTLLMDTVELLLHQDVVAPDLHAMKPKIPSRPEKAKPAKIK